MPRSTNPAYRMGGGAVRGNASVALATGREGAAYWVSYVEHFYCRVMQDAVAEGTAAYWRRRAAALLDARPTATDYIPEERRDAARERWRWLTEAARACEAKAAFIETYGPGLFAAEVEAVVSEQMAA